MGIDDEIDTSEKRALMGREYGVPTPGGTIAPDARIQLKGTVMQTHTSGFCVISVDGPKPTPTILVHGENLQLLDQ